MHQLSQFPRLSEKHLLLYYTTLRKDQKAHSNACSVMPFQTWHQVILIYYFQSSSHFPVNKYFQRSQVSLFVFETMTI